MDKERFRTVANDVLNHQKTQMGIGTLSERSVHAVLKRYYGSEAASEIPFAGFVADLLTDRCAIEIQTRQLRLLRRKLAAFLALTPVTLVHPVALKRRVIRIDVSTGLVDKPKSLPQKGNLYQAFVELSSIREFLSHPGLTIQIPLLIVDDIRLKNIHKKGSKLVDKIPAELVEEWTFQTKDDYRRLLLPDLPEPFTSLQFAKEAKIPRSFAQSFLLVADTLHIVQRVGKDGNAWLYRTT